MRKIVLSALVCLALLVITGATSRFYYGEYLPVFMDYDDLLTSVKYIQGKREMVNPGKIYYKSPYIYVNERYKGIYVINNSNPENPVMEGFITVPGCLDMAVKGNVMYLDNAVDLVAFNLDTKQVTERLRGAFPEPASPSGEKFYGEEKGKVVVGWKKRL